VGAARVVVGTDITLGEEYVTGAAYIGEAIVCTELTGAANRIDIAATVWSDYVFKR